MSSNLEAKQTSDLRGTRRLVTCVESAGQLHYSETLIVTRNLFQSTTSSLVVLMDLSFALVFQS